MSIETNRLAMDGRWMLPNSEGTPRSLMTRIGILEGDVLAYLEEHGSTVMRRVTRELEGPFPLIMMAIGALVRRGLVRAVQHDLEIILEPLRMFSRASEPVPEVWSG